MTAAPSVSSACATGMDLPSTCAHSWRRQPDRDPSIDVLAYRCEHCGALGERRFGTQKPVNVVEPRLRDFWDRGRVRTERDRRRHAYVQLSVDDLIDGEVLTLAEACSRPPRGRPLRW